MLNEAVTSPCADYKYYKNSFHGIRIPEKEFRRHEIQAEAFLHRITFGRIKRLPEIPDEVKNAVCSMAEIAFQEGKKTPGIRSENKEGYSVTYGDSGTKSMNDEMYQAAKNYLSDTGLLFRGRSRKYDYQH